MTMMLAFGTLTPTSMTVVATSTLRLPSAKAAMVCVLCGRVHAAVQEADAFAEHLRQMGVALLGAARSETSDASISGHTQ